MRKYLLYTLLIGIFFSIASCTEDEDRLVYDGPAYASFTSSVSGDYAVEETSGAFQIEVGVNTVSSSARTIEFVVDPATTAVEGTDFDFISKTVTIDANAVFGTLEIQGKFANLATVPVNLIINIKENADFKVADYDPVFSLSIVRFCPLAIDDFVGTFDIAEVDADGTDIAPYQVTTTKVNATTLLVAGLWEGYGDDVEMVFDADAGTVSIAPQLFYTSASYGPCFIESSDGGGSTANGVFKACQTEIDITSGYACIIQEGDFAGYNFTPLVITSVWTKAVKKNVVTKKENPRVEVLSK